MATIYLPLRSVEPSADVPAMGAARGAYARAEATQQLGYAVKGAGRTLEGIGDRMERQRLEIAGYQADTAALRLDEQVSSELRNWDKTNHLDDQGIGQWPRDAEAARQRLRQKRDELATGIDPKFQAAFHARTERILASSDEALYAKVDQHTKDFYRATLPEEVGGLYERGMVQQAADRWRNFNTEHPEVFSEQEQATLEDDFEERSILGAMQYNYESPELIDGMIEQSGLGIEKKNQLRGMWNANQKAARLAVEQAEKERVATNDRMGTARTLATISTDPAVKSDPAFRPMTPSELIRGGFRGDYSEEMVKWGVNALTEPSQVDPQKEMEAEASIASVYYRAAAGQDGRNMKQVRDVIYKHYKYLTPARRNHWIELSYSTPNKVLADFRNEADRQFAQLIKPDPQTGLVVGFFNEEEATGLSGEYVKQLDEWTSKTFTEGVPLDRAKYMEGVIGVMMRVIEQAKAPQAELTEEVSVESEKRKGPKSPAGLEDIWETEFTASQRKQILAYPPWRLEAFINAVKEKRGGK